MPIIAIVAAVVTDGGGRILFVRKRGTLRFMLPGGKPAAGEGAVTALCRELDEELGCATSGPIVSLGQFQAAATNEPGHVVDAAVFTAALAGNPVAAAEIAELWWFDPAADDPVNLAPLLRDGVLPHLAVSPTA